MQRKERPDIAFALSCRGRAAKDSHTHRCSVRRDLSLLLPSCRGLVAEDSHTHRCSVRRDLPLLLPCLVVDLSLRAVSE